MRDEREELAVRIRAAVAEEPITREMRMFGAVCFMVNERMVVAAQGGGSLLVRVDPGRYGELTALTGATGAAMGTGRTMGPGWISVERDAIQTDEQLSFWIDVAKDYHASAAKEQGDRRV